MTIPADADAEPTSPTATEGDASTPLPVGVTTLPEQEDLDKSGTGRHPPSSTDLEGRGTTRRRDKAEYAAHRVEETRPWRSRPIIQNAGSSSKSGIMDALRSDTHARIISQWNPRPATVGETPVPKEGLPLSRRLSRLEPPRPRDTRTLKKRPTRPRPRRETGTPSGDELSSERASNLIFKPQDTWEDAPGENQKEISRGEPTVPVVFTGYTLCSTETPLGTEEITEVHVAKLASMCTFGQALLISPAHPHPPSPAVDTSSQHATTTPSEATIFPLL